MTVLIILFFILLAVENSKLKKENTELKKRLGISEYSTQSMPANKEASGGKISNQVVPDIPVKKVNFGGVNQFNAGVSNTSKTSQQQNNSASLFIVGAILIVLASLIFIGSSWDLLPGLIKTIILVGFQIFFYMMSNVCRDKYKLEKTSNVFFYLAMIFVPILLLSLSLFHVVGEFFSVNGDGFLLYIGITFLLSDLFYKIVPTTRKNIRKFGVVSEIISLLFILHFFQVEFANMMFILTIYNVIVFLLLHGNFLKKEDYEIINSILFYGNMLLLMLLTREDKIIVNVGLMLYAILSFLRMRFREKDKEFHLVVGLLCYAFGLEMICNLVSSNYYFLYLLLLIPLYGLCYLDKSVKIRNILCYGISIIGSAFSIIYSFGIKSNPYTVISLFLVTLIYLVTFVLSKKHLFKYFTYLGIFFVLATWFVVLDISEFIKYIPLGIVFFVYFIEYFVKELKDTWSSKVIMVILTIESIVFISSYSVLIPLLLMIGVVFLNKEKDWYLLLPMLCGLSLFQINDSKLNDVMLLGVICLLSLLSMYKKKINVYSVVSFIAIVYSLSVIDYTSFMFSLLFFIWGISHVLVNGKERSRLYKFVSAISGLGLYLSFLVDMEVEFTSIYSIGYFVTLIYLTRYVMPDNDFRDFIEYFSFIIIALACLIFMHGEIDGLLEVFILFVMAIVSYGQYPSYFRMSIVFIVLYVLLETAEFLFMIPWYVYVLGVGFAFIMMGTREEKKKRNRSLKENTIDDVSLKENKDVVSTDNKNNSKETIDVELPIVKDNEKK